MGALPGVASADSTVEAVLFGYTAPASCPGEERFLQAVSARTTKLRLAFAGEPARRFVVTVEGDAARASGALAIVGVDGSSTHRDVGTGACEEVVSALALVTALAIDPDAVTEPSPPPATSSTPGMNAAAVPASGAAVEGSAPPVEMAPPSSVVYVPPVAPPALAAGASAGPPRPSFLRWEAGGAALTWLGMVSTPAFGGGIFVGAAPRESGRWSPSARLSLFALSASPTFLNGIGSDLFWGTARLDACVTWNARSELGLGGCAAFDAGLLRSRGTVVDNPEVATRPWLAPGALGRLEWTLGGALVLEATAGVTFPIRRYPFSYRPTPDGDTVTLDSLPALAGLVELGAGYRFR
jgi:hypothetical protein